MKSNKSITIDHWHQLSETQKEILRTWAIHHDIGLAIVPNNTSSSCDYAALLTTSQLKVFLQEKHVLVSSSEVEKLWGDVKTLFRNSR